MNPAGKVRCNMRKQIELGRGESSRCCFARMVLVMTGRPAGRGKSRPVAGSGGSGCLRDPRLA
jgi:hypothetical protein